MRCTLSLPIQASIRLGQDGRMGVRLSLEIHTYIDDSCCSIAETACGCGTATAVPCIH